MPDKDDKVTIESITSPGRTERVSRAKYMAMRGAPIAVDPLKLNDLTTSKVQLTMQRRSSTETSINYCIY